MFDGNDGPYLMLFPSNDKPNCVRLRSLASDININCSQQHKSRFSNQQPVKLRGWVLLRACWCRVRWGGQAG